MCNKKHVSHRQTWKTTGGGGEGATPSACYRDTVLTDTILAQFYNAQGINGNGDDAGGGDDDDGEKTVMMTMLKTMVMMMTMVTVKMIVVMMMIYCTSPCNCLLRPFTSFASQRRTVPRLHQV